MDAISSLKTNYYFISEADFVRNILQKVKTKLMKNKRTFYKKSICSYRGELLFTG